MNVLVKVHVFIEIVFNQKKSTILLKIVLSKSGLFRTFCIFGGIFQDL